MKLTNIEFMILHIICELTKVSGYEIHQLVKHRGYQECTGSGTVLVGVVLKKLIEEQLIKFAVVTTKQARDPMLRKYETSIEGKNFLRQEIILALCSSRERDYRFDLAMAAISLVTLEEVIVALENRKNFLVRVAKHINTFFESQGGKELPLNLQALFRHPLLSIKSEIEFMDILLQKL